MKQVMNNAVILCLLFATGFLLGGCDNKENMPQAPPPPEVEALTLAVQPVELSTELPGRTAAHRIAEVRPQVGGIIQKRLFIEGTEVKAGQLLYQIDPATYQANYDSAKAALARAEALEHSARLKAGRYDALVRSKAVSDQDQVEMEANWKQAAAEAAAARAALSAAKINLDYTRVTAPISGRVGRSMVTEGALVTANQPGALAVIQQLDPLYVDLNQSSMDLVDLKREISAAQPDRASQPKSEVTVLLEDGSVYQRTGILEFAEVSVNQSTGTVVVRAVLPNPDRELLPGMFVRARISKGVRSDALLVPAAAIIRDSRGQATVRVVDKDNKVELRVIKTGQAVGENNLVTEGLAPGERIIVNGLQKAQIGAPVRVVETLSSGKNPEGGKESTAAPHAAEGKKE